MNPLVLSIVAFIQLAIKAAPTVKAVYEDGRALVEGLFQKKLISVEQQQMLMAWADTHMIAVNSGTMPPEFSVEDYLALPSPAATPKVALPPGVTAEPNPEVALVAAPRCKVCGENFTDENCACSRA